MSDPPTAPRGNVYVLYEHGSDPRPFSHSYIRLLRPLAHPLVRQHWHADWGLAYDRRRVDLLIVERLWRPDVDGRRAEDLLVAARESGVPVCWSIDDDLPTALQQAPGNFTPGEAEALAVFMAGADCLLVATDALAARLPTAGRRTEVVPNAFDERLLVNGLPPSERLGPGVVIGYMGTRTHAADLAMAAPGLRAAAAARPGLWRLEIVGAVADDADLACLEGVEWSRLEPTAAESEYPLFMLWLARHANWDAAIAPLVDNTFNRAKSDVKSLDYAAIGAAGIYSAVPPYSASVLHGETGWLTPNTAADWADAICRLVDDAVLRRRLAYGARANLLGHRTLAQAAETWVAALNRLAVPVAAPT